MKIPVGAIGLQVFLQYTQYSQFFSNMEQS